MGLWSQEGRNIGRLGRLAERLHDTYQQVRRRVLGVEDPPPEGQTETVTTTSRDFWSLLHEQKLARFFRRGLPLNQETITTTGDGTCCCPLPPTPGSSGSSGSSASSASSSSASSSSSSSGSSASSSSSAAGGIVTSCCPGVGLPSLLHVTLSGGESGSFTLSSVGPSSWTNQTTSICGNTSKVTLTCNFGQWSLSIAQNTPGSNDCGGAGPLSSSSCTPFQLVFSPVGTAGCCNGVSFTVTITV